MTKCKIDQDKIAINETETTQAVDLKSSKKETAQIIVPKDEIEISNADPKLDSIVSKPQEKETKNDLAPIKEKTKKPINAAPKSNTVKPPKNKIGRTKKPKIQFEELTWDFGEITEGDIIEKKFKFTNTGNAPLEIIATSATCGCTRPSFPFLDIAPGESNVIGVNYNSVGKDGEQHPEVTIESNTGSKTTIIKLHGTVIPKPKKEEISDTTAFSTKDTLSVKL